MEAEYFTFEPGDVQILEEIEFDETIQRPERVRFYTLDEQVTDAFDKLLPKGKVTKVQIETLEKTVERLRDLYTTFIDTGVDEYRLREPVFGRRFDWITPVYAPNNQLVEYSFEGSWTPLYYEAAAAARNFYPRMIHALPRPYAGNAEGVPYPISRPTEFTSVAGTETLRALPDFEMTRTLRHEDGRADILTVPVSESADLVNFVGYYVKKRGVPIPNPVASSDFFKSDSEFVIESTSPLSDLVPSLNAILDHGVPVTHDPYREGMRFLKVYDVKLSDIPWTLWRSRFPPIEELQVPPELVALAFPKPKGLKPPPELIELYGSEYFPGMSPRQWLATQLDGGELLIHILRSEAGKVGSVNQIPGIDGSEHVLPPAAAADCELTDLNFTDFTIRGTMRRSHKKDRWEYVCVPLELVRMERKQAGYKNRLPWKETTGHDIQTSYRKALLSHKPIAPYVEKDAPKSTTPARQTSPQRSEIVAVLGDDTLFAEDKLKAVNGLLRESILNGKIYIDQQDLFVLCQHTIGLLEGDLARDEKSYYDTWTSRVDGFRVCKYCGEQLQGDILINTVEFDEMGRPMLNGDVLETKRFSGVSDLTQGMQAMKSIFQLDFPSDEVFFMILSLLQVSPEIDQVMPILSLRAKYAKLKVEQQGIVGIAQACLLLQSHVPFLIPRRSFGSRPLKLNGPPRDPVDPAEKTTIVDTMILILQRTLEAYPTSFNGSSVATMRDVLSKPTDVRRGAVALLGDMVKQPGMKGALERAREHVTVLPVMEQPKTLIPVTPVPTKLGTVTRFESCVSLRPYWTNKRPAVYRQPESTMRSGIFVANYEGKLIDTVEVSIRATPAKTPTEEIRKGLALKSKAVLSEDWRTNAAIVSRIADLFQMANPTRTIDPTQSSDLLRDIAKGMLLTLRETLLKDPIQKAKLEAFERTDATLVLLTMNLARSKTVTNTLRAKERQTFTERMRMKNDADREITKDLIARGLAPYIITKGDRVLFAKEMAASEEEKLPEDDEEVGVGQPIDNPDGEPVDGNGNYGDQDDRRGDDAEQQPTFDDNDENGT
jgi:hypothetical protein